MTRRTEGAKIVRKLERYERVARLAGRRLAAAGLVGTADHWASRQRLVAQLTPAEMDSYRWLMPSGWWHAFGMGVTDAATRTPNDAGRAG